MGKDTLRIISPNGHLGFAPTKEESFWIGARTKPDYYCCDSGSNDIGLSRLVPTYVPVIRNGKNTILN